MTFKAGDAYALKLSRLATGADEIAKKAIYTAAGIVADGIRTSLQKNVSSRATGDLEASLGITPISEDQAGNWNAKIGFSGYDRKGVPNQLKARVLESGSSTAPRKTRFVSKAVRATKPRAIQKMNQIIAEEIQKQMK